MFKDTNKNPYKQKTPHLNKMWGKLILTQLNNLIKILVEAQRFELWCLIILK